ncbi:hypothetical protein NUW54_g3456 [Trametes sanguinea]|uniref:Uncharacterized protein n=1 Tax=Trametes sanguinea TaxID=158606 RepID=A0ACC1Q3G2_9APHY|nr:hypothetical protein NUW54_g3456 [Trametes sanguinea]
MGSGCRTNSLAKLASDPRNKKILPSKLSTKPAARLVPGTVARGAYRAHKRTTYRTEHNGTDKIQSGVTRQMRRPEEAERGVPFEELRIRNHAPAASRLNQPLEFAIVVSFGRQAVVVSAQAQIRVPRGTERWGGNGERGERGGRASKLLLDTCPAPDLEAHGGLYVLHSHLNHSCAPNASVRHLDQRTALSRITVLARRDIAAGEELTITYVNPELPLEQRRRQLMEWGFGKCMCERCVREEREKKATGGDADNERAEDVDLEAELKAGLGVIFLKSAPPPAATFSTSLQVKLNLIPLFSVPPFAIASFASWLRSKS